MKLIQTTNGCYINADAITRIMFSGTRNDCSSCITVKMSDCENEFFCIGEYSGEYIDGVLDGHLAKQVLLDFLANENDGTLTINNDNCLKAESKRFPAAD